MDIVSSCHPQLQSAYQEPHIVKQGVFTCSQDLLDLNIIDFSRVDSWKGGSHEALGSIASWFIGRAVYTVMHYDLTQAPPQPDWPGWGHTGEHAYYARLFWNDFYWKRLGELRFGDSPDFSGTMESQSLKRSIEFWGDIGKVSAGAFSRSQKNMQCHDLWISIPNRRYQIVIEAIADIAKAYHKRNEKVWGRMELAVMKERAIPQAVVPKIATPTLWD